MKTGKIFNGKLFISVFIISTSLVEFSTAQIKVQSNGNIGLGTTAPSADLTINGFRTLFEITGSYSPKDIEIMGYYSYGLIRPTENSGAYCGWDSKRWYYGYFNHLRVYDFSEDSDIKIKRNISNISGSLNKVLMLRGVKYQIKPEYLAVEDRKKEKEYIGFIAQEVKDIIPEIVNYDSLSDSYAISYTRLIPLLVEAMKELSLEIENLKTKEKLKSTESNSELYVLPEQSGAALYQNAPNPFTENTVIEFYLPQDVSKANLYIYDLQGRQIKNIDIVQRESGSVTIHGEELQPGMYKYALIADGKIIGTETMILTD